MADQAHQQSLADLCTVCYNAQPKYNCPRCKTQTCSLACYKRHQQRASCNGQRDPAAFVKKSSWATPSGIDHDYNYLKSVERKVDSAWQDVQERGIDNRSAPVVPTTDATTTENRLGEKQVAKAWLPGSALQRYLGNHIIHVERAPAGMSRQRANRTRVTNKGKVLWSVEWVDGQGVKTVDDESAGDATIGELWAIVEARKINAERGKKRKRTDGTTQSTVSQVPPSESKADDEIQAQAKQWPELLTSPRASTSSTKAEGGLEGEDVSQTRLKSEAHDNGATPTASPGPAIKTENACTPVPQTYFYLFKPSTVAKSRVLIPIEPDETLTKILKHRTVLEFPTIYVLPEGLESLAGAFMLERDYNGTSADEPSTSAVMPQLHEVDVGEAEHIGQPLDANSILDMLQRDVGMR
ncbi:Box C/D snoRNA accumulation [Oleoguttula sp. CCFEE 5521]